MRPETNMQIEIAGFAAIAATPALTGEPDRRAVAHTGGNIYVDRFWSHLQCMPATSMRFFKRYFQFGFNIAAAIVTWTTSARPAKHLFEDVEASTARAETSEIKVAKVESARAWSSSCCRSLGLFPSRRRCSCPRSRFNGTPVLAVFVVELSILCI